MWPNGGKTTLTSDEIASALSFSILGMPPDDALINAAAANQLGTGDARAAQVDRLIAAYPDAFKQQMTAKLRWRGQWKDKVLKPTQKYTTRLLPRFSLDLKRALNANVK